MLNICSDLEKKIYNISEQNGIDHKLLLATAKAESNFTNSGHRPEPGFWKMYMRKNMTGWVNQFKSMYKTIEPTEEMLIFLFASSYGMCQIMYTTALSNGFKGNPLELFDETTNLTTASKYLKHLYGRYPEIRNNHIERMKFTIAAYNAGRGNINRMLRLCRAYFNTNINENGKWQEWDTAKHFLVQVTGKNSEITIKHIDRVMDILK